MGLGRILFCLLFVALPGLVPAQEQEAPGQIATTWIVWTRPGQAAEFEAAIKTHAVWRKQAGDPMRWRIYSPVAGDDLDHYVIRSGGHQWADFDVEEAWAIKAEAGKTYQQHAGAHTARAAHHFGEETPEHSHWIENENYRFFGVNRLRFEPGAAAGFYADLKTVVAAAKAAKWPRSWVVIDVIGGSDDIDVVWPYTSYADMQRTQPGFDEILAGHMGSKEEAQALLQRLNAAFAHSDYTIYRYRPDLSTPE